MKVGGLYYKMSFLSEDTPSPFCAYPPLETGKQTRDLPPAWWYHIKLGKVICKFWSFQEGFAGFSTPFPMTDPWDWYIYLHENHKNQPNVAKYTIHGSYGFWGNAIQFDEHVFQVFQKSQQVCVADHSGND